uniref:Uncharacterized protein n=1 Tax=Romanomermis culicivorax TaxID=13658 RepID=A0A915KK17_ROMCU
MPLWTVPMFHFHLCGDIQDIFPVFAHDFQTALAIAYNADQIHEHLSDQPVLDQDLDMYKEAIKRFISHIDQDKAGSYCSYCKINHDIVLPIDPFPSKFRNHVIVNRADKPKPSVRNPKKTKQQLEEEEDEQYALIDEMQHRTETDPALLKEYEALGGYLFSDPSDAKPVVARMPYGPQFTRNDPLPKPTTFTGDVGLQHPTLFPYLFDSANQSNSNRIANDISPILYYFWPITVKEGPRIKAEV